MVRYFKGKGSRGTRKLREVVEWHEDRGENRQVESKCPVMPAEFIDALRTILDCGMTCKQTASLLILFAGLKELLERFDEHELVWRSYEILKIMRELKNI